MTKFTKNIILAGAIASAFGTMQAQAQSGFTPNFVAQDLLLMFRGPGANDVAIDLGNVSTFLTVNNGNRVQINQFNASQVGANAGSGNLNSLSWTAAASIQTVGNYDLWVGSQRGVNTDSAVSDSTVQKAGSNTSQSGPAQKIGGVGSNGENFGTTLSPSTIAFGDGQSWSYSTGVGSGNFGSSVLTSVEALTGASFSGASKLDFYFLNARSASTAPGVYEGYFELNSDGTMWWTDNEYNPTPVPEPATYGLLAGLGALAVALRGQIRKANA